MSERNGVRKPVKPSKAPDLPTPPEHSMCCKLSRLSQLLDSGALDEVTELEIEGDDGDYWKYCTEKLLPLFRSERLRLLRELRLFGFRAGDEDMAALAASPLLSRLDSLKIVDCHMTADQVRTLVKSPGIRNLTELGFLGNVDIGEQGVRWLVKSRHLQRLERLDLDGCGLTLDAVLALAKWPGLASVTSLNLSDNELGPYVVPILGLSSFVKNLRHLYLEEDIPALMGAKAAMQTLSQVRKTLRKVKIEGL